MPWPRNSRRMKTRSRRWILIRFHELFPHYADGLDLGGGDPIQFTSGEGFISIYCDQPGGPHVDIEHWAKIESEVDIFSEPAEEV